MFPLELPYIIIKNIIIRMYVSIYAMRKNSRLKVPVTVSLDYEYLQTFEKEHKGELSAYINTMLKEQGELQKNDEAQCDPLGLIKASNSDAKSNNTRQSTLFETFGVKDRRDEIVKFVHSIADTNTLNQIEQNCKCMLKVSEVHRSKILVRR